MKDRALQLVRAASAETKKNVLREYLQMHILSSLQRVRSFEQLAFVGGTALRFLYGLRRYSEDLDFSLEASENYDFQRLLDRVKEDLIKAGFEVSMHPHEGTPVHSAFIRIPGLLAECGLSSHATQKLSIKIEVDTAPPAGADLETTIINREFLIAIRHHALPSLMAGKLHAVLSRSYTKGRDIYDLLWYLSRSDTLTPNLTLLQNALLQTSWNGLTVTADTWKTSVECRLREMDFAKIVDDVLPFLENRSEQALLTLPVILGALHRS